VRQLCIGVSITRLFMAKDPEPSEEVARLWKHAIAVGLTARTVAKSLHHPQCEVLFTAGLLHDIGHVILLEHAEGELKEAARKAEDDHSSILDAEASVLGFDHRHVGEWLASEWRLPRIFQIAIARHHDPESYAWESEAEQRAIAILALADEAAHFRGISFCRAQPTIDLPDTLSYLELEADEVTELTEELPEQVRAFYSCL
jgi:putative nucleotidyltransferase with HDIG domain